MENTTPGFIAYNPENENKDISSEAGPHWNWTTEQEVAESEQRIRNMIKQTRKDLNEHV